MKEIRLLIWLFFLSSIVFAQQNKKIDSLRMELKKKPSDFYLQREIINIFINTANIIEANKEIENAKIRFKSNKDYYNYFIINDVYVSMLQNDFESAEKKLNVFEKKINFENLPLTKIHFYFFKGVIQSVNGDQKKAKLYFEKSVSCIKYYKLDTKYFLNIYNFLANTLVRLGQYQNAIEILFEILKVDEFKIRYPIYNTLGVCFYNLNQLEKAEYYYKLSYDQSDKKNKPRLASNLGLLLLKVKKIKDAENLIKKIDYEVFTKIDSSYIFNLLGEINIAKQEYSKAIVNFKIVIEIDESLNDKAGLANDYLSIGSLFIKIKDIKIANDYFKRAYTLLNSFDDKHAKKELLQSMVDLEFSKSNNFNGNKYFKEFLQITDSINSESIQTSTNALNLKYETELKETKIKTQQLQIQKEKSNKNIALLGIAFILFLGIGGFWLYRNKQNQNHLKTQNTLLGLQQSLIEAELSNLNKQLDPHEIKNLLANISPEIQEKAPASYKKMLKLFNLTKASLNSSSITESIENQLQQIDDFLSLEKSMLSIPLSYSIENHIHNTQTQIPRLLLKNLVENALKHGIKQQESGGNIAIKVEEKHNFIYISVDDTGKGRNLAISLDSGIGTTTYQKLFATLNPKNKENATFEIIDKQKGTNVVVKIPIDYKYV